MSTPLTEELAAAELRTIDNGIWNGWVGLLEHFPDSVSTILIAIIAARPLLRGLPWDPQRIALLDAVIVPRALRTLLQHSQGFQQRWNLEIPDSALFMGDDPMFREYFETIFENAAEVMTRSSKTEIGLDRSGLESRGRTFQVSGDNSTTSSKAIVSSGARDKVIHNLPKGASQEGNHVSIKIWYGTTRQPIGGQNWNSYYSGKRAKNLKLQFGTCDVSIPIEDHDYGKIERPKWWHFEFQENPDRHVMLLDISPVQDQSAFVESIQSQKSNSALVFVHGYNVTFAAAARQMAQVSYDLKFRGIPLLFSWSSRGTVKGYPADSATTDGSVARLAEFLRLVTTSCGFNRVHLLAHSMGAKCLIRAALMVNAVGTGPNWRQFILAAPDVDKDELSSAIEQLIPKAKRITLYASSNDLALAASRKYNAAPRAGESGMNILIHPGIDTIDVSRLDTSLMGHSYYSQTDSVVSDLTLVVNEELPPERRARLEQVNSDPGMFWRFA